MSKTKLKGFKVTDVSRTRIYGLACRSLEDLKRKASMKLQVGDKERTLLYLQDGTIVDSESYFSTLEPQTLLILARNEEKVVTGADLLYNAVVAANTELLRAGEEARIFMNKDFTDKIDEIVEYISSRSAADKTLTSSREEHPEWFLESDIFKYNPKARYNLLKLLDDMKHLLTNHDYQSYYFDRGHTNGRLCDETGLFTCDGPWVEDRCSYEEGKGHKINPYSSREERIVFSTWNLDHRIEKSRTIFPCLLGAAADVLSLPGKKLNSEYFYSLLFTTQNLNLVHIVCHAKGSHKLAQCDPNRLFTPMGDFEAEVKRCEVPPDSYSTSKRLKVGGN